MSDEAECWKAEADALRRIVLDALAEREAMEWQPIATAPRDGSKFDVWVPSDDGGYRVTDLHFNEKGNLCRRLPVADLPRWPSHWRPSPLGPQSAHWTIRARETFGIGQP